ncbi:hypothetical protein OBBRIDRAFT_788213 [Obba rivulosa]|uniref:Uncharacterized protein n=1 Tax=Obba rivulosa TaxID=1052685 RepID=A0A8E2DT38_9APHY|nr:hypothetical protein OBBRIDRAFT_788213 [Obba rivulosa]
MNSFWSFLDWILPPVRLSDDLEAPYTLSDDGYSVHITSTSSLPTHRGYQATDLRREATRDRDRDRRESVRDRAPPAAQEREKDRQRIQALERENAALQQRVSSLESDLRSARETLVTYNLLASPVSALRPEEQVQFPLAPDTGTLRTSYDSLFSSYSMVHRTLQERTEEVASLRTFLSKTDEWSGAQLIQALHDLNSEIVQLAASVADEFSSSLDRRVDLTRHSDRELVNNALGPVMTNLLATRDHMADPTLVQFAIQAWEVSCVGKVLDAFCFGLPADVDQFLSGIFEHMHRAEPQPTTSRWRALTYTHARAVLPVYVPGQAASSSPFQNLIDTNLRGLLAVLAISGCTDSRGVHREPLRARFGAALARIGQSAERIAGAVKEGVMSGVFQVTWIPPRGTRRKELEKEPERWFDWASMENVYAGCPASERSRVLCTLEFGLVCVRKEESAAEDGEASSRENGLVNGYRSNGSAVLDRAAEPVLTRNLLMKPKVLLESVTDIL